MWYNGLMKYPNLREERKLWKQGFRCVVGIDEVGRGPLAGPVVASAVFISPEIKSLKMFDKVKDSKKLSCRQREYYYDILMSHPEIKWGTGFVSEKAIDRINIFEATKLAMKKAVLEVRKKLGRDISFLILDGSFRLSNLDISQKSIVKGDEKVLSCALASIVAKVKRDRLMARYHKKFPEYGFDRHKGYGTKFHYKMLEKLGPSVIHRKSFDISGKIY